MIAALLLTDEEVVLDNVPDILDVRTMLDIAGELGADFSFENHTLTFRCRDIRTASISRELCSRNRTSILFAAPLLARCGKAELYPPGGDVIGRRRLDGHFYGLCKLGAVMSGEETYRFDAPAGLSGRELFLDEASVTATEQILIAAAAARGTTTLYNAACEPHVRDLAELLNAMGARISGAGSNTIEIEGVERLHGCRYRVVGDHIEAAASSLSRRPRAERSRSKARRCAITGCSAACSSGSACAWNSGGIIFFCPAGRNAPSNATSAAISRRSPTARGRSIRRI